MSGILWSLTIESEKMSVQELCSRYRLRWQIELSFKAWKQSQNMESSLSRKSNQHYLESIIFALMIRFVLSFHVYKLFASEDRLSMDKLFKRFSEWLVRISSFRNMGDIESFTVDKRHIQRYLRNGIGLDDIFHKLFNQSLT